MRTLSFSSVSKLQQCERKYWLEYMSGITFEETDKHYQVTGKLFHAGIALWLMGGCTDAALNLARLHVNDLSMEYGSHPDIEFCSNTAKNMLSHYLPELPIGEGKRYRVVRTHELYPELGGTEEGRKIVTELHLKAEIDGVAVQGYVDAVLYDNMYQTYVIVDWKTRSTMPQSDTSSLLDMQLDLYAAMFREQGLKIDGTTMWLFSTKTPAPAKINKDGTPSLAANAGSTTREVWRASLPANVDPDKWEQQVQCIRPMDYFMRPIESFIQNDRELKRVVNKAVSQINQMDEKELPVGVYNSYTCKGCKFSQLCLMVMKGEDYGVALTIIHGLESEDYGEEYD